MAARNRRIEPVWGPPDHEKLQKQREKVKEAAGRLAMHDDDEALQTLQRVREDIISGEYFHADYREDTTSSRQVDRVREELMDAIFEMVQHSFEETVNTIGSEIRRVKARKRLQKEKEAIRRLKPERKEKLRNQSREK